MCWSVGDVEGWSLPAVIPDLFSQLGPHLRELDKHSMDGCIETIFQCSFFSFFFKSTTICIFGASHMAQW